MAGGVDMVGAMVHNMPWEVVDSLPQVRSQVLRDVRSPRFLVFGVGMPLAIYLAYLATGIGGATGQSIGDVAWPSYLMVSMAAFGAMNAAVGVAAGHRSEAPERRRSGGTPPDGRPAGGPAGHPNLVVSGASAMVLALPPLILVGSAAVLDGMRLPGVEWLTLATSLWLGPVPFVALGLLLGPFLDADTGNIVLLGVLVVLAILGGLFQPVETLPDGLAGFAPVLPSFRLADLGWTALADRSVNPVDVLVLAGYAFAFGAVAVWRKRTEDAQVGE